MPFMCEIKSKIAVQSCCLLAYGIIRWHLISNLSSCLVFFLNAIRNLPKCLIVHMSQGATSSVIKSSISDISCLFLQYLDCLWAQIQKLKKDRWQERHPTLPLTVFFVKHCSITCLHSLLHLTLKIPCTQCQGLFFGCLTTQMTQRYVFTRV